MYTVLLVDSEPAILKLYRLAFEREGFTVLQTETVAGAIEICHAAMMALIVAEHDPAGEYRELLRAIQSLPQPPPVILTTGSISPEARDLAMAQGAAAVIEKLDGPPALIRLAGRLTGATSPKPDINGHV